MIQCRRLTSVSEDVEQSSKRCTALAVIDIACPCKEKAAASGRWMDTINERDSKTQRFRN